MRLTVAPCVAIFVIGTTVMLMAATRNARAVRAGAVVRYIIRVAVERQAVVWRAARPLLLPALIH